MRLRVNVTLVLSELLLPSSEHSSSCRRLLKNSNGEIRCFFDGFFPKITNSGPTLEYFQMKYFSDGNRKVSILRFVFYTNKPKIWGRLEKESSGFAYSYSKYSKKTSKCPHKMKKLSRNKMLWKKFFFLHLKESTF